MEPRPAERRTAPTSYPLPVFNAAALPRPPPPHLPHLRPGRYSLQPPPPPLPGTMGLPSAPPPTLPPSGGTVPGVNNLGNTGGIQLAPLQNYATRLPKPKPAFDLSLISRAETKLDDETFVMSPDLQNCLLAAERKRDPDALVKRVCKEALEYAERRKEIVRESLKKQLRDTPNKLSNHDKGKLRSRREAKVHRVKEQQLELALKAAIRWLIAESATKPEHHPQTAGEVKNPPDSCQSP